MFAAVEKINGGFAVINWAGDVVVAYRNRKHAEQALVGYEAQIWGGAEYENERRDAIAAYLADRAARVAVPSAQLELF